MQFSHMNKLSTEERKQVVAALVEGNSLRSITRMTGVHRTTVMKLLCDLGAACSDYQDRTFRNLKSKRIQCDEIWSFVYAKDKNCTRELKAKGAEAFGLGSHSMPIPSSFPAGSSGRVTRAAHIISSPI